MECRLQKMCGSRKKDLLAVPRERALELVKDTVVLVQVAQLALKVVMDGDGFERGLVHIDIPDPQIQVVSGKDITAVL
jgi:hypothetical protein